MMNLTALREQKGNALVIAGLVLSALAVRLFRLDHQSLWTDEIISHLTSRDNFWTVLTRPYDPDFMLYHLIAHAVLPFGEQEWVLRLPSVCYGVMSVLLFFSIAQRWFDKNTSLVAAALFSFSPFHIWYSQEARPYALLLFLGLLSFWLLQKSISNPHRLWPRCGFVLVAAALFYCHPVAVAFIGLLGICALLQTPRQRWATWLPFFGGIVVLVAPAIYRMLMNPSTESEDPARSFHPFYILYVLWTFATGYSLGPSVAELHSPDRTGQLVPYLSLIIPLMLFFAALFLRGIVYLQRKQRRVFWINVLWFAIPILFAVSWAIATFKFNVRYAILAFPPFLIFLTVGALHWPRRWMRASTVSALLLVNLFSLYNYYYNERYHREDNRAAGQFLAAHAAPGDLVIACASYTLEGIQYYSRRDDLIMVGYPTTSKSKTMSNNIAANGSHEIKSVVLGSAFASSLSPSPSSSSADFLVTDDLRRIIGDRPRVWLFLSRTYHGDPKGDLRRFFNEHFRAGLRFQGPGVEVICYEQNAQ